MKNKPIKFRENLLISTFIHLSFLLLLTLGGGGGSGKKPNDGNGNPPPEKQTKIIPKELEGKDVTEVEVTLPQSAKKEQKKKGDECKDGRWFGGIGIVHTFGTYELTEVPEGYPAHNAGIRVGDIVLTDVNTIRGEVGTEITIAVLRNSETLYFTMIRDKICIEDIKDEPKIDGPSP